jgi:hypothetical protein
MFGTKVPRICALDRDLDRRPVWWPSLAGWYLLLSFVRGRPRDRYRRRAGVRIRDKVERPTSPSAKLIEFRQNERFVQHALTPLRAQLHEQWSLSTLHGRHSGLTPKIRTCARRFGTKSTPHLQLRQGVAHACSIFRLRVSVCETKGVAMIPRESPLVRGQFACCNSCHAA